MFGCPGQRPALGEHLGFGVTFGKWTVGLFTPVCYISSNNLTKWEENHYKGKFGMDLLYIVSFLGSRGCLPLLP